ncbi:hypothetical protein TRAPUB_6026 [Trametes pubescens]|uniref:Uncharacterized protein n=1 Tax=Trametes pubescens TaxID=154538 RepID=A0A1M2V733_TRAPU|nr:hypothetical protein TRAPUB_6026 [Trametes pubescens]
MPQPSRISTSKSKGLTDPLLWDDRDVVAYVRVHYERADAASLTGLVREFRISPLALWYLQTDLEELLRLANNDVALQNLVLDLAAHVRPVVSPTTPRRIHVKQLSKDLDVPPPPPPPPPLEEEDEHEEEDEDLARSVVSDWALDEMPAEAFEQPADQYDDYAQEGGVQGLGLDTTGGEETFHDAEAAPAQEDLIGLENEEEAEGQGASEVPIHDSQPGDEEFFELDPEGAPGEEQHLDEEDAAHSIRIEEGPSERDDASYEPPEDETEAAQADFASGAAGSAADLGGSVMIAGTGANTTPLEQEEEGEENPVEEEPQKEDFTEASGNSPEVEVEEPYGSAEETDAPAQPVGKPEASTHTEIAPQPTDSPAEEPAEEEPKQVEGITSPSPDASSGEQGTPTLTEDAAADTIPQTTEQADDVTDPEGATQPAPAPSVQAEEEKSSELETERTASSTGESTSQEMSVDQQAQAPATTSEASAADEDSRSTPPEPATSTTKAETETETKTETVTASGDKSADQEEGEQKDAVDETSQSHESQGSPPTGAADSGAGGKPALTVSVPSTVANPPPTTSTWTPSQASPARVTPKTPVWGVKKPAWGAASGPANIFSARKAAAMEPAPAPSPSRSSRPANLWSDFGAAIGAYMAPSSASPSPSASTPPSRTPGGAGTSTPWASGSPAIRTPAPKEDERSARDETPIGDAEEQREEKQEEDPSRVSENVEERVSEALGESVLGETEQAEPFERLGAAGAEASKETSGQLADVGAGEAEKSDVVAAAEGADANGGATPKDDGAGEGDQVAANEEVVEGGYVNITTSRKKKRKGRQGTPSVNTSAPQTPDRAASPPPSRTRTVTGAGVDDEEKPATASQDAPQPPGNQDESGEPATLYPQGASREEIKRLRKLRKAEAKLAKAMEASDV